MSVVFTQDFKPAYGADTSDFDQALPKKPISLHILPTRIELNNSHIELKNESEEAKHIYNVILAALGSDWYKYSAERSRKNYQNHLKCFISWLNEQTINLENRYAVFKDFESWRVNEKSVKPQSTGLMQILIFLNNGVNADHIEQKALQYISHLLRNTVISAPDERRQDTLGSYFSLMPWLRDVVGERDYLKIESPKILMNSFSIVAATTLLFILEQKKIARDSFSSASAHQLIKKFNQKRTINHHYCRDLLLKIGKFNSDFCPENELTELMLVDFVPTNRREDLKLRLQHSVEKQSFSYRTHDSSRNYLFVDPFIFNFEDWGGHSLIEQYLCAWICAWQTVQPSDVASLKRNNFVINKNEHGKPVAIQCTYYKSRSQREQEPPMLSAQHIEAKALIAYLEQLPNQDSKLFTKNICNTPNLIFAPHTIPERIFRLFQAPKLLKKIHQNLEYRKSSPVFLNVYSAMAAHHDESFDAWVHGEKKIGNDCSIDEYRRKVKKSLPLLHYGLGVIKNSSVHARTDRYRDGDLVNQNSHTSLTEKLSYLTDSNKEWVNQNGRITRLVMKDIESYVYRPNVDAAMQSAYEQTLRTRVIDVVADGILEPDSIKINSIGRIDTQKLESKESEIDCADIIVLNSSETVVTMLHYIAEAERQYVNLINHALDFFERTVLVTVEWMERLLIQGDIDAKVIKEGQATYDQIKIHLPPLFVNELRGAVGA